MTVATAGRLDRLGWIPGFLLALPLVAFWIARAIVAGDPHEDGAHA